MRKLFMMAGLVALGVPMAYATVEVRIENLVGGVAVGDTGWITCAGNGCATSGAVGNYFVTSDTTARLDPSNPFLDMTYSASTLDATPGAIIIEARADGYTNNSPGFSLLANGNTTLTGSNAIDAFGGNANTICPAGVNTCSAATGPATLIFGGIVPGAPSAGTPTVVQLAGSGPGNSVNPYELSLLFANTGPGGPGSTSGDIQLNAVPEPVSVALMGGVVLVAVGAIRRKMRRA